MSKNTFVYMIKNDKGHSNVGEVDENRKMWIYL